MVAWRSRAAKRHSTWSSSVSSSKSSPEASKCRCGSPSFTSTVFLFTSHTKRDSLLLPTHRSEGIAEDESDILQGTLDLIVVETLAAMGPMNGYGITRLIRWG